MEDGFSKKIAVASKGTFNDRCFSVLNRAKIFNRMGFSGSNESGLGTILRKKVSSIPIPSKIVFPILILGTEPNLISETSTRYCIVNTSKGHSNRKY